MLLGKDANYPAPLAFTLAHEIGHVMLGHISDGSAIVELGDPGSWGSGGDVEEATADAYALSLLTGTPSPVIQSDVPQFGARQLAEAAKNAGHVERIEAGTLALCYAFQSNEWSKGMASLRFIYEHAKPVWQEVNAIANTQLDWSSLSDDTASYVRTVMGLGDA